MVSTIIAAFSGVVSVVATIIHALDNTVATILAAFVTVHLMVLSIVAAFVVVFVKGEEFVVLFEADAAEDAGVGGGESQAH